MIFEHMCEKNVISKDFKNGQALTSVRLWRALFAKDGDGALSVCRKQIEALPTAVEARTLLEKQRELVQGHLSRISQGANAAMERLPRAQGFFTGAADRAVAYGTACEFLELLRGETASLDEESMGFSNLYALLRTRETERLQAEASVLSLRKIARESNDPIALDSVDALSQILSRYEEENLEFLSGAKRLERALEGFCAHTCREFCRYAAVKADLEHEGAGASPAELSRLLWGLRQETERLLKEI